MKIITCGPIVTYVITEHHVATIVYSYNDGAPSATIYYDGQLNGVWECENGRTMRLAMQDAIYQLKSDEHWGGARMERAPALACQTERHEGDLIPFFSSLVSPG